MAMWLTDSEHDKQPLARIDLTPLVGVLAALLAILVLQMPPSEAKAHQPLAGPLAACGMRPPEPDPIELRLDMQGRVTWNGVSLQPDEFDRQLGLVEAQRDRPQLHLLAPQKMKFQYLAAVVAVVDTHNLHLHIGDM
jgi:biopolymer transport protein ExbD